MKNYLNITLLLILICSCSDVVENISENYWYRNEGGDMKQILSYNNKYIKNEIYGRVINYRSNSKFITVIQNPSYKDYIEMLGFNLRDDTLKYPSNSINEILKSEAEAKVVLKTNEYYKEIFKRDTNYWIIQLKNDSLIGPLDKIKFGTLMKQLNIPERLNLVN